ncbi:MAG: hypothetical protein LAT83_12735 [Kiritimatiellae bacterium]|nr:hypothetical protein [Kiritimatiellia bacterium]
MASDPARNPKRKS